MSGYYPGVPVGYHKLTDIRDQVGDEQLGIDLSLGRWIAFAEDMHGKLKPIPAHQWRGLGAREMMATGRTEDFSAWGEGLDLILVRPAVATKPTTKIDATPAAPPPWWPDELAQASVWVVSQAAVNEANARVRRDGAITEGLVVQALEMMWKEAGRETAEGSFGRLRRRYRGRA